MSSPARMRLFVSRKTRRAQQRRLQSMEDELRTIDRVIESHLSSSVAEKVEEREGVAAAAPAEQLI